MKNIHSIKKSLKFALTNLDNKSRIEHKIKGNVKYRKGGFLTGYSEIDNSFQFFNLGELAIIGGLPSSGKTSFMFNIFENMAISSEKKVLIISYENNPEIIALRLISSIGRVDISKLMKENLLSDDEWPRVGEAVKILASSEIYISYDINPNIEEVKKIINNACEKIDISIVAIDPIQGIKDESSENKSTELTNVSRELKSIALKNNLLIFATSHLNRYIYQRHDKRAILPDLLGSGSLEYDADYIIFIHRQEQLNLSNEGVAEINFAKNKMGKTFTIKLNFIGKYLRFDNLNYL